jgi:hypothetical protein
MGPRDGSPFLGQDHTHSNRGRFWRRSVEAKNESATYDPQALPVLFLSLLFLWPSSPPVEFPSATVPPSRLKSSAAAMLSITITSLSSSILILFYSVHYPSSLRRSTLALALLSFSHSSPLDGIGRRRTAEDYHRTTAKNGWAPGAHEEEDGVEQTKDEGGKRYKQNQQEALDQWVM